MDLRLNWMSMDVTNLNKCVDASLLNLIGIVLVGSTGGVKSNQIRIWENAAQITDFCVVRFSQ